MNTSQEENENSEDRGRGRKWAIPCWRNRQEEIYKPPVWILGKVLLCETDNTYELPSMCLMTFCLHLKGHALNQATLAHVTKGCSNPESCTPRWLHFEHVGHKLCIIIIYLSLTVLSPGYTVTCSGSLFILGMAFYIPGYERWWMKIMGLLLFEFDIILCSHIHDKIGWLFWEWICWFQVHQVIYKYVALCRWLLASCADGWLLYSLPLMQVLNVQIYIVIQLYSDKFKELMFE